MWFDLFPEQIVCLLPEEDVYLEEFCTHFVMSDLNDSSFSLLCGLVCFQKLRFRLLRVVFRPMFTSDVHIHV